MDEAVLVYRKNGSVRTAENVTKLTLRLFKCLPAAELGKILKEKKLNVDEQKLESGITILFYAMVSSEYLDFEKAEILIQNGADVNFRDIQVRSILEICAYKDMPYQRIEFLVSNGALVQRKLISNITSWMHRDWKNQNLREIWWALCKGKQVDDGSPP